MTVAVIILSILLTVSFLTNIIYRRQIREICRQISFIRNNQTNMKLTSVVSRKEFTELVNEINSLLEYRDEVLAVSYKKDRQLRSAISGFSHDIRTPLTSLDGYFQLLYETDDEETRKKYLKIIKERISSLRRLLDELFTYSKLQDSEYAPEMASENINKILYDSLFSYYDEFTAAGIEPDINIPDEVFSVFCNKAMVQRLTENIIKNSLVHSLSKVSVSLSEEEEHAVIICSNDTADAADIDASMVFERFYKADQSRHASSTGLGLAIAKQITEKMNGKISASVDGDIFTVTVRLPLIK